MCRGVTAKLSTVHLSFHCGPHNGPFSGNSMKIANKIIYSDLVIQTAWWFESSHAHIDRPAANSVQMIAGN